MLCSTIRVKICLPEGNAQITSKQCYVISFVWILLSPIGLIRTFTNEWLKNTSHQSYHFTSNDLGSISSVQLKPLHSEWTCQWSFINIFNVQHTTKLDSHQLGKFIWNEQFTPMSSGRPERTNHDIHRPAEWVSEKIFSFFRCSHIIPYNIT